MTEAEKFTINRELFPSHSNVGGKELDRMKAKKVKVKEPPLLS
jgi:hypothetical protein